MSTPAKPLPDLDDDAAELEALKAAVAESDADPRPGIPHEEVREWLLKFINGEISSLPPLVPKP